MRININNISNKKPFVAQGEIAAQDLVEYFDDADECADTHGDHAAGKRDA